ncbi:hypothetical protein RclHR1_01310006 [Rhizophagus clarus]|uniref:Uncharacterized protein n=1 Tax=Rhizophagus clarus TaxID=94130 RepID=A0A2Z6Q952_9GLOM|nr:hypothetical protein RclHR1_01310006 [Rhizophagus clarus]
MKITLKDATRSIVKEIELFDQNSIVAQSPHKSMIHSFIDDVDVYISMKCISCDASSNRNSFYIRYSLRSRTKKSRWISNRLMFKRCS